MEENDEIIKTQQYDAMITINDNMDPILTDESEKKPNILKQFIILKVYLVAISVFSISFFTVLLLSKFSEYFL